MAAAAGLETKSDVILRVATVQFGRSGYSNCDVQVIANEAGLGKATIYRLFNTKEDLFIACLERGLANLNEHCLKNSAEQAVDLPLPERILAGMLAFFQYFDKNPEVVEILLQARILFKERAVQSYRTYWEFNISLWLGKLQGFVDQGLIQTTDTEQLLETFNDLLYGALLTRYFGRDKKPAQVVARALTDSIVFGIISDGERERLKKAAT